jgi:hypothetical protein
MLGTTTLNFSPGDYATPKAVTVTGLGDNNLADESGNQITLSLTGAPSRTISFTTTDHDVQAIILTGATSDDCSQNCTSMSLNESWTPRVADQKLVLVKLAFPPLGGGRQTVSVISSNDSLAVINQAQLELSFDSTPANLWSTAQAVAVTAVPDMDGVDGMATVTLSPSNMSSGSHAASPKTITVTVHDND